MGQLERDFLAAGQDLLDHWEDDKPIYDAIIRKHRERTGCSEEKPCAYCAEQKAKPFKVPNRALD